MLGELGGKVNLFWRRIFMIIARHVTSYYLIDLEAIVALSF